MVLELFEKYKVNVFIEETRYRCTLKIASIRMNYFDDPSSFKLEHLDEHYGISVKRFLLHSADYDALLLSFVFVRLYEDIKQSLDSSNYK